MTSRSNMLLATPEQIGQAQSVIDAQPDGTAPLFSSSQHGPRPLPPELASVLDTVLHTLARGGSFTIETMPEMLTTTQAARLLDESRPTLMKRIATGQLASVMVGTHHRLRSDDVLRLREQLAEETRREDLDFLRLEDELGL